MSGRGITIIGASAGSGKTTRLTQEVTRAVAPASTDRVPVDGLFAVTYTKKAQAELAARIRRALVKGGAFDEALRLPLAYLGTVHAACLRLIQEFALDAGLSPNVDVVAEDQSKLLREALDAALSLELRERIERLASRLRLRYDPRTRRFDWLTPVGDIMDLARGNRIRPEALPAMAERSLQGLLKLLPPKKPNGQALDEALARELERADKALRKAKDGRKTTERAMETIAAARARLRDDELDWCDWAQLASLKVAQASERHVTRLRDVAAEYEAHPRLHDELRELTFALFEAARVGLTAYQQWKTDRRVVDYVDMLDEALTLLDHPRVRQELAERLRFVVVDEFQDTSPIQLALFVKLHAVAGRSVWVGDRKQCIFEYAGADPLLMDAVANWVVESGGTRDLLPSNFRSRPELVQVCSELFTAAMAPHGFTRAEVAVAAARKVPPDLAAVPPIGLWYLEGKNRSDDAECIAAGVKRLLEAPEDTRVVDRTSGEVRGLRPGDIAVLVATNEEASEVATALHARGIRVAVARSGLLKTPEGTLMQAALRLVLDESDSLAAATLDAFHEYGGMDPDEWLTATLRGEASASVWQSSLRGVRERLTMLSPSEVLEEVIASLDAVHLAARWPDAPQRVANLDALRVLAAAYEERCAQAREAATVAGLLRHFEEMGTERVVRNEKVAFDEQHVPADDGAVVVCTYHKAKGLEWPVVILGSLGRKERRHAFEVSPESDGDDFDPTDPLKGRWIRYWVWPFGRNESLPLREVAELSDEGRRVATREHRERVRLLYVGFTRARDHLVLAVRVTHNKTTTSIKRDWLDELKGVDGDPLVELPADADDRSTALIRIRRAGEGKGAAVSTRVFRLLPTRSKENSVSVEQHRWFVRAGATVEPVPAYRLVPSNATHDWPELVLPTIGRVVRLSGAMPVRSKGVEFDVLGDAVHAFLAADLPALSLEERRERAKRLLAAAGLAGVIQLDALIGAGDRLREFVQERWGEAIWHREVPIEAWIDTRQGWRRVGGTIDLLLETPEGYVVIDHKTFPGESEAAVRKKAQEFLPQLGAYMDALRRVPGAKIAGCWLHFPVSGAAVEVST